MTARAAGRTDDAMAHYEQALALSPQLAEAHMNVASLLSQMPGREEEALEHYAKALELREWPLDLAAQAEYNSGIASGKVNMGAGYSSDKASSKYGHPPPTCFLLCRLSPAENTYALRG